MSGSENYDYGTVWEAFQNRPKGAFCVQAQARTIPVNPSTRVVIFHASLGAPSAHEGLFGIQIRNSKFEIRNGTT
jgi:hypothetical protein